jgi:hypothetical protein
MAVSFQAILRVLLGKNSFHVAFGVGAATFVGGIAGLIPQRWLPEYYHSQGDRDTDFVSRNCNAPITHLYERKVALDALQPTTVAQKQALSTQSSLSSGSSLSF